MTQDDKSFKAPKGDVGERRAGETGTVTRLETVIDAPLASALEKAAPPFHLPPLPKSRRTEIRVPASISGGDLSKGATLRLHSNSR